MIRNDQVDIDELEKTCQCVKNYFIEISATDRKSVEIFLALLDLTTAYIRSGAKEEDMIFTADEICNESANPKTDYQAAKDFVSRHKKEFDKFIESKIEEISHFCSLNGVKFLPTINNTDSSGGRRTYFYIGLVPMAAKINHEVGLKNTTLAKQLPVAIEYTVPQLPKPPTWAKPLLNLEVSGWKLYFYVGLPMLGVVFAYLLMIWNVYFISSLSVMAAVLFVFIVPSLYLLLQPFYEAMNNRIAIAPAWLLSFKVHNAQIRAKKIEKQKPGGRSYRALQIVIHKATCPICNSEIDIEQGKREFKGRLIGVCTESPREHIFSFDHVTKKGVLLR